MGWTWLLLAMMEEKVCYRYVREHSQRQEHLGESRVEEWMWPDWAVSHGEKEEGKGEGEKREPEAAARRLRVDRKRAGNQNGWII